MLHWFAKRLRYIQEVKREERGFTLIELLVVVIIIGILAAIAIPAFLSQRDRAESRAAQANLRNAATAQQSYYTENGVFTSVKTGGAGTNDDLADYGFREGKPVVNIVTPATGTGAAYCMTSTGGSTTWKMANTDGTPVQGGTC